MKSQIKRFSKSTLSVILSLCMLVSCMTVGIIAIDAAYDNSDSLGVSTSDYIKGDFGDSWAEHYFNSNSDAYVTKTVSGNKSFEFNVGGNKMALCNWSDNNWGSTTAVTALDTQYNNHNSGGSTSGNPTFNLGIGTYRIHATGSGDNYISYRVYSAAVYPSNTKYYLDTSDFTNWENDSARFAVYFCNSGKAGQNGEWVSASPCPGLDHHYYVTSPANSYYTTLIWCRMKGNTTTNSWDNRDNQTGDLSYESGKYTTKITDWGAGTQNNTTHSHTITIIGKGRNYAGATISNLTSANSSGSPDWTSQSTYNPANYKVATAPSDYTYTGMYTNPDCTTAAETSISNTGDATYYALYTRNKVNVNFKNTSGTGGTVSQGGTQKISSLTTSNQSISTDYNRSLSYTITPASGKKITAVSGGGTWTIASEGTSATCTFAATATTNVTVTQADAGSCGFTLDKSSATLNIGGTTTFTATPNSYHTGSGTIFASSSNTGVATVSKSENTYTVTAVSHGTATITVSCTEGGTATFEVTVSTPSVSISLGKTTLNIGETTIITPTVSNNGTASVTYSSSDSTVASITNGTIKALKPGTTNITATVDGVTSTAVKLTVSTPTLNLSYNPSTIYTGGNTTSPNTVTASNANSESTISSISFSKSGTAGTINASTGVVTSSANTAGTVTVTVTATVSYNGVTYTGATGTANVIVSNPPNIYIHLRKDGVEQLDKKMIYDDSLSKTKGALIFKYTAENITGNKDHYLKIYDGSNDYKPDSEITTEYPISGDGVSGVQSTESTKLTTGAAGTYIFYFDLTNHKFYVDYPELVYSYTVNAMYAKDSAGTDYSNTLSGETVTPASGTWREGDSAVSLSAAEVEGYQFAQWAVTSGTGTLTNATSGTGATFVPTSDDAVVTAQYKKIYSVSFNEHPNNGTVAVSKTSNLVAGETFTVTFTPNSGYILDIVTVSNDSNPSIASNTYTGTASGDASAISVTASFAKSTVTAAGNSTALFGTTWDSGNASNNMSTTDDINYTKVYSNVALTAGTIELKVVKDHNWNTAYPTNNYQLTIPKNGNYNITITYNNSTNAVKATADLIKEYYLLGFGNGDSYWGTSTNREVSTRKMTYNSSTGKYTFTYNLVQQTYGYGNYDGFKVYCNDGTWYGHNGNGDNMTRSASGPWTMGTAEGNGNIGVVADVAGDYIFEFDPSVPNIKVYYPSTVTFDTHGGSTVNSQVITYGGYASKPTPDPTKTGHTFTNWYTAESGGTVFNFTNTAITQNTTVHAQWTRNSYNITYNENNTEYTIAGTKPSSAYYGDSVSFTVTAKPGYRIDTVTYNDGSDHTLTSSNSTYSFNMPASNVTVSVTTVKTYTVSLTAGTGISTKQYRIGASGSYSNYSNTLTVDTGSTVSFKITYDTGYEFDSSNSTLDGAAASSSNTVFTLSNITSNKAVTIAAKLIDYTLSGSVSPAHGTLKFYEDDEGVINLDKELPSPPAATFEQYFWAVYIPDDNYTLESIVATGGNTKPTRVSTDYANNRARFQMGAADGYIKANVVLQHSVTYYIDMHNTDMTGNKKVSIGLYDKNGTILSDARGNECKGDLTRVNNKTNVYSISIVTPFIESDSSYEKMSIKPKYNGNDMPAQELTADQVTKLLTTKEVWLEAVNEESKELKLTYNTKATPAVQNGYRRIYLARPYNWCYTENNEQKGTDQVWNNIGIYYWGSDYGEDGEGWFKGTAMNRIGGANADDGEYCYYYVDIPKTLDHTIGEQTVKDKIDNIIFQGWSSNTRVGDNTLTPDAQTEDIKQIADSDNFFVLSKNGSTFTAEPGESVVVPDYTRYVQSAQMNVNVYSTLADGSEIKINPTYTGEKITYTSSDEDVVTVDANGKITPHDSGTATITVKIYGTIGKKLNDADDTIDGDYLEYDVTVTVNNPGKLNSFELMSLESAEYTVNIPKVGKNSNVIPGYFDMSKVKLTVTGIKGLTSSTTSAIVTESSNDTVVVDGNTYPTSFTVKYAKSMDSDNFDGYDGITLTGDITTKSIRKIHEQRYGLAKNDPWKSYKNNANETSVNCTISRSASDGVETALAKNIVFNSSFDRYSALFNTYDYVDVTFIYDYYEYVPETFDVNNTPEDTSDDMINYMYNPEYAGTEDINDDSFDRSIAHKNVVFKVVDYEVRDITAESITSNQFLANAASIALGVGPDNNYYDYKIDVSTIPEREISRNITTYTATVYVHMKHSPKRYSVYLNGIQPENKVSNPNSDDGKYYYQEDAEPTVDTFSMWYAVDKDSVSINKTKDPLLATGKGYSFKVKGDTYLRTEEGDIDDEKKFNRSEVDFSHYETVHQGGTEGHPETLREYLLQNFYIADFFDPNKVFATRTIVGSDNTEKYKPEDPQFVGGGVVYFSVDGTSKLPRSSNAVGLGYVNSDGTLNQDAVKEMLKSEILSSVNEDNYGKYSVEENGQTVQKPVSYESLENAIGTEDALKVAYGTEIAAHQYVENNIKTGVLYRYLPLETFSKDSDNWSNGVPVKDEKGNYYTTLNNNTFRYSNTLQSYQYVYASGNENKETNAGKNMRLYSYYVYSYVAYNQETNVPETKYEIVLSDNYSDASTYWNGNTGN